MCLNAPPRLLIVEDDTQVAGKMIQTLRAHFDNVDITHHQTITGAFSHNPAEVDLVLTSMNLPDGTGLELLDRLQACEPDLPVVLVTGVNVAEVATAAIARGAYDYVVKAGEYLRTIPLVVEKDLALWRTRQENHRLHAELKRTLEEVRLKNEQLEAAVAELKRMAATDSLTGLGNRRAFARSLDHCFAEAQRHGHDLSCLMIDLDDFKQVNDTLGHQAGDRLLIAAGRVLSANCRRSDIAARYGGDEFVLLMPQTSEDVAHQVAERIHETFTSASDICLTDLLADMNEADAPSAVTMSMGLASLRGSQPATAEHLIAYADHALYRAKLDGKERLTVYHHPVTTATAVETSTPPALGR